MIQCWKASVYISLQMTKYIYERSFVMDLFEFLTLITHIQETHSQKEKETLKGLFFETKLAEYPFLKHWTRP